jgi:hypothetical protein
VNNSVLRRIAASLQRGRWQSPRIHSGYYFGVNLRQRLPARYSGI